MSRAFIRILVAVALAVAALTASIWRFVSTESAGRPRASRTLAAAFQTELCRPPSGAETVQWDTRPFTVADVTRALESSEEGGRVRQIRELYVDVLRREASGEDCRRLRDWIDRGLDIRAVRDRLSALPEAQRIARVRQMLIDRSGWDPRGWDDPGLRRWTDSPFTIAEIRSRLAAARPLVGVHYFLWYRLDGSGWRNDSTIVRSDSPKPALGWYDSSDPDVMVAQIDQMERARFDFVIVHIIAQSPSTWANARTFIDRLSGRRLKVAVMLDGLNAADAATKTMWVRMAKAEFTGGDHYLTFQGQPLLMLFSARLDFEVPGVLLRNVYWSDHYDPGGNNFNIDRRLEPGDWPFWAPTPQPLVNGVVPVIPGYSDTWLRRSRAMEHSRDDGRMYREQWQRALALHPELILVYGWNEYFERTAIEPTDAWGDSYLQMTACYIGHAHHGSHGEC